MPNERLQRELEKGLPAPLYFLWDKESFFLEDALVMASETVVAQSQKDFNYNVFYSTADLQGILDTAYTLPLFTPRRMVVIKDFHDFSKANRKALAEYLKKPSRTTCMLILSKKAPDAGLDFGMHIYAVGIKESDIPSWLKQMVSKKGCNISDEAADLLIESVGFNAGLLVSEIEKLSYLPALRVVDRQAGSGQKKITVDDVLSSTGMTREFTSFNLVDALIARQKGRAFRILNSLIVGKGFDAPSVLGPLNWHYRQFYALWQNKGKKPPKMRDLTYNSLRRHLPGFSRQRFRDIFRSLHEADLGIKSSGRPEIALELLLIKLLQSGSGN